jgi:hypothetical protein
VPLAMLLLNGSEVPRQFPPVPGGSRRIPWKGSVTLFGHEGLNMCRCV